MSFLDSEFVQKEIDECTYLRELSNELEQVATETQNEEIAIEYYHVLYGLLNKQEIIYTRLSLLGENDKQALEIKQKIQAEMIQQGMPSYQPVIRYLEDKKDEVKRQLKALTGEDVEEIDIIFDD
jgi:hypothetical protein